MWTLKVEDEFVGIELRRVNIQLCYPHNHFSDFFEQASMRVFIPVEIVLREP
jgi:hypothetical protein